MKKREKMKQKFLVLISLLMGIFVPGSLTGAARQRVVVHSCENVGELYEEEKTENDLVNCAETEKIVSISKKKAEKEKSTSETEKVSQDRLTRRKRFAEKMKSAGLWMSRRKIIIKLRRGASLICGVFRKKFQKVGKCPVFHRQRKALAA